MGKLAQNKPLKSHIKISLLLTILGILIALFFGIYSIYSTYQENKSEISFEIINEANILDIHEPLSELTIYFQGEDIQEKNLNLRIITIRIENSGNVDILQSHYDINDIWGVHLKNGEIVRIQLIDSNSEYLKTNLKPRLNNETIEFTKTIFEKGKYFTIEILVLHKKDKSPEIIPIGKIAGIEKITPVKLSDQKEETIISSVFYGNIFINLIRLIFYVVLTILSFIFFLALSEKIDQLKIKRHRKKIFDSFIQESDIKFFQRRQFDILKNLYVNFGYRIISRITHYFKNDMRLLEIINEVGNNDPLDFKELVYKIKKINRKLNLEDPEWDDDDFAFINYLYKNDVIIIKKGQIFPETSEIVENFKKLKPSDRFDDLHFII
jgi:hypothetical protein